MAKEIINQLDFEQAHSMWSVKVNKNDICLTWAVVSEPSCKLDNANLVIRRKL